MAIVKMSKFNLIIFSDDRDNLLETLQKFKYIHFLDLHENKSLNDLNLARIPVEDRLAVIDEEIRKVSFSINILKKYDSRKTGVQQLKEGVETFALNELKKKAQTVDFSNIYEQVKYNFDKKENIKQDVKRLKEKTAELRPWISLAVPLEFLSSFKKCRVDIGTVPKRLKASLQQQLHKIKTCYYQVLSEDYQHAFFMTITHESEVNAVRKILINHGFSKTTLKYDETPQEEISHITEEINLLQSELQTLEEKLKEISQRLNELELVYDYLAMKKMRISASKKFLSTDQLNAIEGYIPSKFVNKFQKIANKHLGDQYYLHLEEAKENDPNVPIMLDNSKFFQAFESVTKMYALPKYNEVDPTPLFSIFYSLFFGMMIGDAGYGLLMLAATSIVLKFLKIPRKQRNFIQFFYYLSFFTILWGVIYGSFFGDMISLPSLINSTEEYNLLLILAIALGGIHIFFGLGIRGYMDIKKGKFLDALFDVVFWYMALGGAIVYLLALFLPILQTAKTVGLTIMIIGMVGILLTGGRNHRGIVGKIAGGLYSLYGISKYVGDFVSYSRLMALGLASAFIAIAINLMVSMLFDLGIIGIIIGIIVFVVGQSFNIFLSMLSSYVHTLRLTYVEFFGKFYEGGGKVFQVFQSQSKYIDIK